MIRSNEHGLERHRNSLALGQMLNARGKFGNFGFDKAFDREEYDTRNPITPHPKGTRLRLFSTHEEWSSIIHIHQIFHHTHFRKFIMSIAPRMRLLSTSPSCYGFFIHVAFVFCTKEIATGILTAKPK